jgi:hypothetical protein
VCVCVCIYIYIYIYICVCVCVCVFIAKTHVSRTHHPRAEDNNNIITGGYMKSSENE